MSLVRFFSIPAQLLFRPYTNRLKLGEGGLVILNFTHSLVAHKGAKITVIEMLISFLVMCVLYGYNDYIDCEKDKLNPKKDMSFIHLISENKSFFIRLIMAVQFVTVLCAWYYLGWRISLILVVLFFINYLYSQKVKSIPVLDIVIVSIWGGLYVCLSGNLNYWLSTSAGLMTGIAHFFQVVTDKETDEKNNIVTSAVIFKNNNYLILLLLCMILALALWMTTNIVWIIILSAIPFLIYFLSKKVTLSWHVSRTIFFLLWLILLRFVYAGI